MMMRRRRRRRFRSSLSERGGSRLERQTTGAHSDDGVGDGDGDGDGRCTHALFAYVYMQSEHGAGECNVQHAPPSLLHSENACSDGVPGLETGGRGFMVAVVVVLVVVVVVVKQPEELL